MSGVGPFSMHVLMFLLCLWLAWFSARVAARRWAKDQPYKTASGLVLDALWISFIAARLAYIVQWWPAYQVTPWSMLAIWDGGYLWWVGLLAGLAWIYWRSRANKPKLGRAAMSGLLLGTLAWVGAGYGLDYLQKRAAVQLPVLALDTLTAQSVDLQSYRGRPLVVNLWASWCPPCRREMPAFVLAEKTYPMVTFVMINQGESHQQVQQFLQQEGLDFSELLLDPSSQAMHTLGARVLPMTFFFDASGRLVRSHMGEMTLASLSSILARYFADDLQSEPN